MTTGAGLLSQIAASIRITAIGRFLRICGIRSDCEKRNEQNGHQAIVCSHLELLLSSLEWWRPRPERRAGWPLGEGRQLGGGDLAKLRGSGLRIVW